MVAVVVEVINLVVVGVVVLVVVLVSLSVVVPGCSRSCPDRCQSCPGLLSSSLLVMLAEVVVDGRDPADDSARLPGTPACAVDPPSIYHY